MTGQGPVAFSTLNLVVFMPVKGADPPDFRENIYHPAVGPTGGITLPENAIHACIEWEESGFPQRGPRLFLNGALYTSRHTPRRIWESSFHTIHMLEPDDSFRRKVPPHGLGKVVWAHSVGFRILVLPE